MKKICEEIESIKIQKIDNSSKKDKLLRLTIEVNDLCKNTMGYGPFESTILNISEDKISDDSIDFYTDILTGCLNSIKTLK